MLFPFILLHVCVCARSLARTLRMLLIFCFSASSSSSCSIAIYFFAFEMYIKSYLNLESLFLAKISSWCSFSNSFKISVQYAIHVCICYFRFFRFSALWKSVNDIFDVFFFIVWLLLVLFLEKKYICVGARYSLKQMKKLNEQIPQTQSNPLKSYD